EGRCARASAVARWRLSRRESREMLPADPQHDPLDVPALIGAIDGAGLQAVHVRSAAPDRATLLGRPELGERLDPESLARLRAQSGVGRDVVLVVADGLAPRAAESHAIP